MKTKFLVLAAIAAAVLLALSTDKGKEMSEEWMDESKKKLKKLKKLAGEAGGNLGDLKKTIMKQASGLSAEACDRIMSIIEEGTSKAKDAKSKAEKELA